MFISFSEQSASVIQIDMGRIRLFVQDKYFTHISTDNRFIERLGKSICNPVRFAEPIEGLPIFLCIIVVISPGVGKEITFIRGTQAIHLLRLCKILIRFGKVFQFHIQLGQTGINGKMIPRSRP